MEKNPLSFQLKLNPDDFLPATDEEKESLVVMRDSVSFWKDGFRRLRKNKVAMVCLFIIIIVMIFAFIVDYAIRVMMGSRISLLVGIIAAAIILVIGSIFGSIAAFAGGWVDLIMMRIVDIIYTIPDVLLIVLLSFALKAPLKVLAQAPGFGWISVVGENLISIFIVFALLYWVGMARMVRSQILMLKESEYVTAARALGASSARIIKKHLLTNCIGTLIVTTTLQIPSSIFTESFLSFLGLGVAVPMPSLGSLASDAINGLNTYPYLLFIPAAVISLIILSFNLLGDGLRDAFDPKLKN